MSELLQSSIFAAISNSVVAILFKIITFALNAFIIRRVSGDVLGIVNVRLILLVDTIIFISREAFRKACLKKPENGDWRGTINAEKKAITKVSHNIVHSEQIMTLYVICACPIGEFSV